MLADNLEVIDARLHVHVRGSARSSGNKGQHQQRPSSGGKPNSSAKSSSSNNNNSNNVPESSQSPADGADQHAPLQRPQPQPTAAAALRINVTSRVRAQPRNYTRIEAEFAGAVPATQRGRTVAFNVTELVREWMRQQRAVRKQTLMMMMMDEAQTTPRPATTVRPAGEHEQALEVRTEQPWMGALLTLQPDTENVSGLVFFFNIFVFNFQEEDTDWGHKYCLSQSCVPLLKNVFFIVESDVFQYSRGEQMFADDK